MKIFSVPITRAKYVHNERGQSLVTLLIFVSSAIIITSGAVIVAVTSMQSTTRLSRSEAVFQVAQAGVDEATIQVLRNPAYTAANFVLTIGEGTATINVSGLNQKTIISEGTIGTIRRKIQVTGDVANNAFTVTNWQEID